MNFIKQTVAFHEVSRRNDGRRLVKFWFCCYCLDRVVLPQVILDDARVVDFGSREIKFALKVPELRSVVSYILLLVLLTRRGDTRVHIARIFVPRLLTTILIVCGSFLFRYFFHNCFLLFFVCSQFVFRVDFAGLKNLVLKEPVNHIVEAVYLLSLFYWQNLFYSALCFLA